MSPFLRKHGGYIIDYAFCVIGILLVLDYFILQGEVSRTTIQAAFALYAMYAFVVTRRMRYLRKRFDQSLHDIIEAQSKSVTDMARRHADELERLRKKMTPGI